LAEIASDSDSKISLQSLYSCVSLIISSARLLLAKLAKAINGSFGKVSGIKISEIGSGAPEII